MIVVKDIQEKEVTIYNPDGTPLVVTHNMLCVNDILIQIKILALEGYSCSIGDSPKYDITKAGRIKGQGFGEVYSQQMKILMNF